MLRIERKTAHDHDFRELVRELDADLAIRDGDDHQFYADLNAAAILPNTVVAYEQEYPVASGALREYEPGVMEVKRMYVRPAYRGKGIASVVLNELENWCRELGYQYCILETGINQPEAIRLYGKNHYTRIPNYGKYAGVYNSVCFKKQL